MEYVTVVETNPYIFVHKVIDAIREGYFVESSNRGWISESHLKEINLYKNGGKEFDKKELGEFVISDYSSQNFLYELCNWVGQGAHVDVDSLFWDTQGIKSIKGKLFLPVEYTKEQLSEMSWSDFKDAVRSVAGTHRDRTLLTTRYLTLTGQL